MSRNRDKRGRSKTDRFIKLPHYMVTSSAYRGLSLAARAVLTEVMAAYTGFNNGSIGLSVRTAAWNCGCSIGTAGRALKELQRLGFLELVIEGKFTRKDRHASEWRLTLHACDRYNAPPSKAFMRWQPTVSPQGPSAPGTKLFLGITSDTVSITSNTVKEYYPHTIHSQYHQGCREHRSGTTDSIPTDTHLESSHRGGTA
jgi:hypothetical protein